MKKAIRLLMLAILAVSAMGAKAQVAAIKTNVLSDIAATPNIGVEVGLAPHWTLDINGSYNDWSINHKMWKHWFVQPEARYWFCEKFQGNFIGIHAIGGRFEFGNLNHMFNFLGNNFKQLENIRSNGYAMGAGISYGHSWVLAKNLNLEAEIGIGWMYTRSDKYDLATDNVIEKRDVHHYVGPTKLALNLVYLFN